MNHLPFSSALPLLTDFYQVTMSYGYWKTRRMEMPAVFSLFFRSNPFKGGYSIAAGLETAIQFLEGFRFSEDELSFLSQMKASDGSVLFEKGFIDFLRSSPFQCEIEAVPEGSVVFPLEPLVKVKGPIWQCQWIETALLNIINFQTLIATKAARITQAAKDGDLLEFGLRRAQGFDGAISASRAAFIGGASSTSNLLASRLFGIPARGTHAHSWVMSFDSEQEAFDKYAEALPDRGVLLVDTYDTINGVKCAIETGKKLAANGRQLGGVRLDSGDLAYLSAEVRKMLDDAGLTSTRIVASNELDEHLIQSLHLQDAKIDVWGVGTKLVTGSEQGAMNGVYKLAAVFENEHWKYKIKVSDQPEKTTNPGIHCLRRFYNPNGAMEGDLIFDESEASDKFDKIVDPVLPQRSKRIRPQWTHRDLLVPVFKKGKRVYSCPSLIDIQSHAKKELASLHPGVRRFENPHLYPVGLSPYLAQLKSDLIREREKA